tara:strand:- start:244 stop:444 length:201 start_codon:yes stop_codon:yes gene_type:complete
MKVGDLVRRTRYRSPDGRIAGRSGKEAGVGLIVNKTKFGCKIKWQVDGEIGITWVSEDSIEMVSER